MKKPALNKNGLLLGGTRSGAKVRQYAAIAVDFTGSHAKSPLLSTEVVTVGFLRLEQAALHQAQRGACVPSPQCPMHRTIIARRPTLSYHCHQPSALSLLPVALQPGDSRCGRDVL
jgi:hypothetical protein